MNEAVKATAEAFTHVNKTEIGACMVATLERREDSQGLVIEGNEWKTMEMVTSRLLYYLFCASPYSEGQAREILKSAASSFDFQQQDSKKSGSVAKLLGEAHLSTGPRTSFIVGKQIEDFILLSPEEQEEKIVQAKQIEEELEDSRPYLPPRPPARPMELL
jgi:hypothetical protein